ncbi:putative permease [Clostridium magnum DSM 2767]|uniref:Putative permease n=1 Tax=Clostridium magnum DSM 2767 TaxID=1121326 RepID=A0A161WRU4_9CLOT|nr:putative permease [Clostridium magnum DSM 2767]SHJ30213.1 hypothetical protein SAMN02745944_05716 [Clostridium magnum DSM 2767]
MGSDRALSKGQAQAGLRKHPRGINLIGIPLYSNAAGVIPLVRELTRAGVSMGTDLAFMMSVTELSLLGSLNS